MIRILVLACAITLRGVGTAAAQTPVPPQPPTCADCAKAAADAAPVRGEIKTREGELRQLQAEQGINDANLNNLRTLREDAVGRGDQAAAQQHAQSINDLQADRSANRAEQFQKQQDIDKLNQQIEEIGRAVDDCAKQCGAADPKLPTGVVTTGGTEIVVGGAPQPPRRVGVPALRKPPCEDCGDFDELQRAHQELQQRADRANERGSTDDLRDFEEQRRRVRDLQRKVDDCREPCKPRTTSFRDPRVIGGVAGGVGLVAILIGGGGNAPPAIINSPVAAPNPVPVPVPSPTPDPPAPAPAPRTTADGSYLCTELTIVSDPGGHDGTIALGRQISRFDVREGSITIRHPAPFVDIVSARFDLATGFFLGTAVGRVAGSPTVGVRAEGTANTSTGRITFDYTMGTGGELPGGRPIVYRITLQRQ